MRTESLMQVCAIVITGAALTAIPAFASDDSHTAISADKIEWKPGPPTLPAGAQLAVLHGSPAKDGPFVIRIKFPAGYEVPPHRHSKEEHVTVISGAFGIGTGKTLNRKAASPLKPGSFVRIPVNMVHFAWTEGDTIVQVNGTGPFDVVYVNPDDDPRKKKVGVK